MIGSGEDIEELECEFETATLSAIQAQAEALALAVKLIKAYQAERSVTTGG